MRRGRVPAEVGGRLLAPGTISSIGPEEYDQLCRRVGAVVHDTTPPDAIVAVMSKGDPRLIDFEGRTGLHFPRDAEGRYAGYHPKTSEDAIAHVESLRGGGCQFLCLPATALWWLDHYQGLAAWLDAHCRVVARDPGTCIVYDLLRPPGGAEASLEPDAIVNAQVRSMLDALLPADALLLVVGASVEGLAAPGRAVESLGSSRTIGLRRLAALEEDRPTFVLIARDIGAPSLDEAFESLLAGRTEPVARREHLCDLLRMRASPPGRSAAERSDRLDTGATRHEASLRGTAAQALAARLERLGLPGEDSSDAPDSPISERPT
jgi:hypothetical protein